MIRIAHQDGATQSERSHTKQPFTLSSAVLKGEDSGRLRNPTEYL